MLSLLLTIKFIIYTYLIKVEFNRIPTIIISSLIAMLILTLINKSKSKYKNIFAFIFYSLVSLLMLVNATYFAQFNNLTSIVVIKQITQLKAVGDSLKVLLNWKILALIIDLPIILIYSFLKTEILRKSRLSSSTHPYTTKGTRQDDTSCKWKSLDSRITAGSHSERSVRISSLKSFKVFNCELCIVHCELVLLSLTLILLTFFAINGTLKSITSQELFTYHLLDIKENLMSKEEPAQESDILTTKDIEELKSRAQLQEGKLTGLGKDKNLIVLQVEALQNFVIDLNYNGQEITPNLNKLIKGKSTVYYNNYYQLLGRGNTSDAEFVSQNSLHPSMEEPTYAQYTDNTFYGLPWLLRDNGYTAWVFHGFEKEFWNRRAAYKNQGFQRFLSEEDFSFNEAIGFGISDEDFFKQSIEYLKELDSIDEDPFYAFIITLTSHTPFIMPEKYKSLNIKEEHKDTMLGNYLQAIHYADKEIGIFIEKLKEEDLYDDTVIALYGDHFGILSINEVDQKIMTEFLGENYDFDNMMNIPLAIHIPREEVNETISTTGSQLDFYPTISNIMGYKNEKGLIFGRDLTNYKGDNTVYPQTYMLKGSLINNDSVFVIARDGIFSHSRAYNIKTKESLDINKFKAQSEKAIAEINKSNYILKNNIFKQLTIEN